MSISSQQRNLIMCATCIREHGQFRSMMHDAWIFILFLGIINDHPHTDRSDLLVAEQAEEAAVVVVGERRSLPPPRHRRVATSSNHPSPFRSRRTSPRSLRPPRSLRSQGSPPSRPSLLKLEGIAAVPPVTWKQTWGGRRGCSAASSSGGRRRGEAAHEGAGGGPDLLLHLILERKLSLNNLWKKIKPAT